MLKFEAKKRRFCKNLTKTGGLEPPGSAAHDYRHKAIQDPKFQVIISMIFEVLRYRFSPLARAMSHRIPISTC